MRGKCTTIGASRYPGRSEILRVQPLSQNQCPFNRIQPQMDHGLVLGRIVPAHCLIAAREAQDHQPIVSGLSLDHFCRLVDSENLDVKLVKTGHRLRHVDVVERGTVEHLVTRHEIIGMIVCHTTSKTAKFALRDQR